MNGWTAFALLVAAALGFAAGWLVRRPPVGETRIAAELGPLREAVGALGQQVQRVETSRADAYAGLREQVSAMHRSSQLLSMQTGQLVTALRAPQVRGRWGEIQLERVVELAGMVRHCDFDTQVAADGVRPDMLVRLSGGRQIIVDAKVPFAAYLDATFEEEPRARNQLLARHARHLREHVDKLADKAYWESFDPTPEFVVLFLPGDPFLDAALTTDETLLEYAFSRNIVLATPTTLVALLRTVALGWQHEALAEDAATILRLGRELHQRIGTVGRHLDRLGGQLARAVDAFNHTVASLDTRVLVTARKLDDLGRYDTETPSARQVETWPRAVGTGDRGGGGGGANDAF